MIYTVTFNPSLDYIVSVDDFKLGMTNRTSSEPVSYTHLDVYKRQEDVSAAGRESGNCRDTVQLSQDISWCSAERTSAKAEMYCLYSVSYTHLTERMDLESVMKI